MAQTGKTKNIGYLKVKKDCERSLNEHELREAEKFHRHISYISENEMKKRFTM